CLRLLDLDDHLGGVEHLARHRCDASASADVIIVRHADALTRIVLDDRFVTVARELADRFGRQSDPVLQHLDFLGYTNAHERSPRLEAVKEAYHFVSTASRAPDAIRGAPPEIRHGPRRTQNPRSTAKRPDPAHRVLDAVHAEPRIQGKPAAHRAR